MTVSEAMKINAISRDTFDGFKPLRHAEAEVLFEETDWFADQEGVVIGVLVRDRRDDDWAYAVLGRDEQGAFRAFANDVGIPTRDEAREHLLQALERALSTGATIFPQDDQR